VTRKERIFAEGCHNCKHRYTVIRERLGGTHAFIDLCRKKYIPIKRCSQYEPTVIKQLMDKIDLKDDRNKS
jgi:hypothetical protein